MISVSIKPGASVAGVRTEIILACFVLLPLFNEYGQAMRVTSGTETAAGRVRASLHITGGALDFGIEGLAPSARDALARQAAARLGDQFDVVLGVNRLHVEFQPKVHR